MRSLSLRGRRPLGLARLGSATDWGWPPGKARKQCVREQFEKFFFPLEVSVKKRLTFCRGSRSAGSTRVRRRALPRLRP
ncbi:hypothetical protein EBZ02_08645 [bacterium]|nr:hypothetical protein [bacterium]